MKINEVISKAIEGGWGKERFSAEHLNLRIVNTDFGSIDMPLDCIFLDPLFWKSLSKAMGWKLKKDLMITHDTVFMFGDKKIDEWQYYWHRMIDKLSSGGTIEEFFQELS